MSCCLDLKTIDFKDPDNLFLVPVNTSNRHLHVSAGDLAKLFGPDHKLTNIKDLTQPGQYACQETVNIVGPKGMLENVRILGPERPATQVELAQTDARKIGIRAPLRNSGDLAKSPGCVLVGPKGYVVLSEGVVVAAPHIHLHVSDGEALGLADKELVDVYFSGEKKMAFFDIMVRVHPEFAKDMHLDTDEANAARLGAGDKGLIVKKS
ncbi:MAG: phosphate propanoyltransferase [Clostridiales bacterium]|jgi:putative phosphotransacetylase|nr:phosphate propanoyltransferase [Clostridiales bacterium]